MVIASAVDEVQVGVDDDVDASDVVVLLVPRVEAGFHVGHRRMKPSDTGVDEHARVGWSMMCTWTGMGSPSASNSATPTAVTLTGRQ